MSARQRGIPGGGDGRRGVTSRGAGLLVRRGWCRGRPSVAPSARSRGGDGRGLRPRRWCAGGLPRGVDGCTGRVYRGGCPASALCGARRGPGRASQAQCRARHAPVRARRPRARMRDDCRCRCIGVPERRPSGPPRLVPRASQRRPIGAVAREVTGEGCDRADGAPAACLVAWTDAPVGCTAGVARHRHCAARDAGPEGHRRHNAVPGTPR